MNCLICGSPRLDQLAEQGDTKFLKCSNCITTFSYPLPTLEELNAAYQSFNAGENARIEFEVFTDMALSILTRDFETMEIAPIPGKRFLDYGCGGGHFVKAASLLGANASGIDVDEEGARFGVQKDLDIRVGSAEDLSELFAGEKFDVIYMTHVLEHVPEPITTLRNIAAMLNTGGTLFARVPDQESFPSKAKIRLRSVGIKRSEYGFVQPPIHLWGFSKESFTCLAGEAGMTVLDIKRTSALDPLEFPSTKKYWSSLRAQQAVYGLGKLLGSGGHLSVALRT